MQRTGDLLIAGALLLFTLPLLIIVALAIRLESHGPVILQRCREGRGGQKLQRWEFRTSFQGSRTRVGRFLWYTRVDNLPQLINVLQGEMSILGSEQDRPAFLP